MNARWISVGLLGVMLFGATAAWADTRYVSDRLVITFREGMGNQFRVIKTLKTDERVEVLSEQDGYLHVRTDDGTEGYVLKQYISAQTPKSAIIASLRQQLQQVQQDLKQQQAEAAQVAQGQGEAQAQVAELTQSLTMTEELLKTAQQSLNELKQKSENVVLIDQERQRLKKDLGQVQAQLAELQQQNDAMLKTAMIKWFVAGGGVLFVGWVAGKFSRKKRRTLGGF